MLSSSRMGWRGWLAATAAFLLLGLVLSATILPAMPALAEQAPAPITIKVKAGYDGQVRFGEWVPLSIDVSNDGPDVSAQLKVQVYWDQGPQSPVTEYVRDLALPRGAKKHVTMFVPGLRDRVAVILAGPGNAVLAEEAPQLTPVLGALAGVLSDSPDAAKFLGGVNLGQANRPFLLATVRLSPGEVPDVSAAWNSLSVLALSDTAPEKLSPEQWGAVEAWVAQGGVLILGGGSQARRVLDAMPESLRPVKVTGTATLTGASSLQSLLPPGPAAGAVPAGQYVVSAGELDKGKALASEGSLPLLAEYRYGKGTVYFSAFDLSGEPMTTWTGSAGLWETLLRRAGLAANNTPWGGKFGPGGYPGPGFPGRFMNQLSWVVRNMPSLEVPSLRTLGLLLFGYALLVGPLMHFLLKKLDRRDWAWVLIPAIAIVAAGSVYGVGFAGKGKDVFTNTVAVLRLEPGQKTSPVQSWVGVFAPSRSQFGIDLPGRTLISPATDPGYYGPVPVANGPGRPISTRVVEGAGSRVELLDWNVWTVRTYAVDSDVTVEGSITGRLTARVENPAGGLPKYVLEGKVTNGLPFDLEDVTVVAGSAFQRVGDLAAGGTVDVSLSTVVNSGQQPFGMPIFYQIYNPPQGGPNFDQEKNRRIQMLDAAFGPEGGMPPHPISLVGWTKKRVADVGVQSRPGRDHVLTLVVAPLDLVQKPGQIVLPPGLLQGRLVESDNVRGGPAGPGRFFLEAGSLTFDLEPNLGSGTQVSSLAVALATNGNLPKVELWNWKTDAWVEARQLGPTDRWVPDGPSAPYLREDGVLVRVRVTGSGQPGDFNAPSLVLEGKVGGQ